MNRAKAVVCGMCLRVLNMEKYNKRFHFADGGIEDGRRLYDTWRPVILRAPARRSPMRTIRPSNAMGTCMGGNENQGNRADPLEERRR